jgi:Raf kinase inhibitor-like YbhB/YbcL family protein
LVNIGRFAALISLTAGVLPVSGQQKTAPPREIPALILTSTAFADGADMPAKFTASVPKAVSPELQWTNVPENTVSFALIFHDPDGIPRNRSEDYLHWLVFNIPGTTDELPEAVPAQPQLPDGTIQCNNRGTPGYLGPGAPAYGPRHHYTFELYALNTKLELGPDATRADVIKAMDGHVLAKGILVGMFHR